MCFGGGGGGCRRKIIIWSPNRQFFVKGFGFGGVVQQASGCKQCVDGPAVELVVEELDAGGAACAASDKVQQLQKKEEGEKENKQYLEEKKK